MVPDCSCAYCVREGAILQEGREQGYKQAVEEMEYLNAQTTPIDECGDGISFGRKAAYNMETSEDCDGTCCTPEPDFVQVADEYSIRRAFGGFIVDDPDEQEHVFDNIYGAIGFIGAGFGV